MEYVVFELYQMFQAFNMIPLTVRWWSLVIVEGVN